MILDQLTSNRLCLAYGMHQNFQNSRPLFVSPISPATIPMPGSLMWGDLLILLETVRKDTENQIKTADFAMTEKNLCPL